MSKLNIWDDAIGNRPATLALINNLSATTNPGASNDSASGYEIGSHWINKNTGAIYVCVDATAGAAVWKLLESSGSAGNFTDLTVTTSSTLSGTLTVNAPTIAAAGATQGNATLVTTRKAFVTASASTEGVKLPVWGSGKEVELTATGAHKAKVWPNAGAKVSGGASNAADATLLPLFKPTIYKACPGNVWAAMRSA